MQVRDFLCDLREHSALNRVLPLLGSRLDAISERELDK